MGNIKFSGAHCDEHRKISGGAADRAHPGHPAGAAQARQPLL